MNSTKKDPRTARHGRTGENSLQTNHTLSQGERQGLRQIMEACLRAIDRRRFTFAEQLISLALAELGRFEMTSGSAVPV